MTKINYKHLILFILFTILYLFLAGCSNSYKSTIKNYIKYMKNEEFEKIYNTLLTDKAKSKFQSFLSEMVNNKNQYETVIDTFKSIKKIEIIQVEFYSNDEIAVKFRFINKNGVAIEDAWWRLKKIGSKYYIMKFSKH